MHGIGHSLYWPHSYFGDGDSQYDNPADIMSGYGYHNTIAFNRLAAGWIDDDEVARHDSGAMVYELDSPAGNGLQMVALVDRSSPYMLMTLEARPQTGLDEHLAKGGVAVNLIDQTDYPHADLDRTGGDRRHKPAIGSTGTLDHVLAPGTSVEIHGVKIEVLAAAGDGYSVRVTGSYASPGVIPDLG